MSTATYLKAIDTRANLRVGLLGILLFVVPSVSSGEIIWRGDYSTGDYTQWLSEQGDRPVFSGIPSYGRPVYPADGATRYPGVDPSYFGNGELMQLVQNIGGRQGYANRITVKNSENGQEPVDCDAGGSSCVRRHTNLNRHLIIGNDDLTMPYLSERWLSISHYIPANWDASMRGGSWGAVVYEIKSPNTNSITPTLSIQVRGDHWYIKHNWNPISNPTTSTDRPWQYGMFYSGDYEGGPYPRTTRWPDGMSHFPNVADSYAALQSLNVGGWTDWVINVKWDGRGTDEGGAGWLTIWKREDSGPWVEVLHIIPGETTVGTMTFNHGIGYKVPGSGFGPLAGLYMDKEMAWNSPQNRTIYNNNIKIGSQFAGFSDMSPDGSSPGSTVQEARPLPPQFSTGQ